MALNEEWRHRLQRWREVLPRLFYRELGQVDLSGFATTDQLTPEQALQGRFEPMSPGARWGAKWEYGWFRGAVVLPPKAEGERIVLCLEPGGESIVFINGAACGARDATHGETTLSHSASAGAQYDILIESYAGEGRRFQGAGPVIEGEVTVPEPPPTQVAVGRSTFGIWEEEVYQLWLDVETLAELRDGIDANSLRVAEIDRGLRDLTLVFDPELPRTDMLRTARAARERLRPLLECANGSTAPTMFAFGHAHIDCAWLWPIKESKRKVGRTFANQLTLMDEYPEYRFLQSQPFLYAILRERYPDLYGRVKEAVGAGSVIAEGGMWVEADTNVTGGESLIRQFVHGKRFFKEELGVDCEMLWLPDVFGYSGAMPQIMRGCGVKYFATAKIFWNYNGGDPFPYNTFRWQGIDGSRVLVHLCNDYNSMTRPAQIIQRWNQRVQKDGIDSRLFPFGWGDGGGGAGREHLEFLRREADLEGLPRVRIASPIDYFHDLEERDVVPDAVYVGELYYQCHRGTYTSQAKTKKGNRKSELALREAEMWGAVAGALKGRQWPAAEMDAAWKAILANQFHDILPGSSIERVYQIAEQEYAGVIETAESTATAAAAALTDGDAGSVTVFNSLSWDRRALVALPEGVDGASALSQEVDGKTLVEVDVPACGWATIGSGTAKSTVGPSHAGPNLLENDLLRVEFDAAGEITSIVDKTTGQEFAAGACNSFRMYRDHPYMCDAWDIESMYPQMPVELGREAKVEVIGDGPLVAALRISKTLHDSTMTQQVSLRRGSRTVECETTIDWREDHKLLKVAFPTNVHTDEAIHEIQFGHLRRPTHGSRPFDADRFEVCNQKWSAVAEENRGFAVLNDCKYGLNVLGGTMNLTLLKSPLAPDMRCDRGRQEFTYAFHVWSGSFAECDVVREAYELNCPVISVPGVAGEASAFGVDAANVIIETVKPAEDGSGDVIVRLYEAKRCATRCELRTSLPIKGAIETDMLERPICSEPVCTDGRIALQLRPFEIKTVRLTRG